MRAQAFPNLGPNIRGLRRFYGETQLTLALAIGVSGPPRISQYETGKRFPEPEILFRLAKHFKVTESQLLNEDYTNMGKLTNFPIDTPSIRNAFLEHILPIICTPQALENPSFKRAHEMHVRLSQAFVDHSILDEEWFQSADACVSLYEAARDDGVIEAAANHLWWHFFEGILIAGITPRIYEYPDEFYEMVTTIKDYFQYGGLPRFDEDSSNEDSSSIADMRKEFLNSTGKEIITNIYRLKRSHKYADLGDYYLALRFTYNLCRNSSPAETNALVGSSLMDAFAGLRNPYARKYKKFYKNF